MTQPLSPPGETPRTVEERLAEWAKQPGAIVSDAERHFIEYMRSARMRGVGFGWMQQVIEWEWQSTGPSPWGPEYFNRRIIDLERALRQAQERIGELEAAYQELDGDSKAEIDAWIDAEEREQKLKERCAELEKDAARYRWLKSLGIHDYRIELYKENGQDGKLIFSATPTMLDEVIDDAASGPKER